MASTLSDNTGRFSDRAEYYAQWRPAYPEETIHFLRREAGLAPDAVVVDVGSGTGLSSELFLRHGHVVYGVEPNPEMRWEAERLLARYPGFRSVNGTAEQTTLGDGCADAIVSGSAFHGFEPAAARAEFGRVLKPGGMIVVMGNGRRRDGALFMRTYRDIVRRHAAPTPAHENREARVRAFLEAGTAIGTGHVEYVEQLDFRALRGRTLSYSTMPLPGQPGHHEMMRELRTLFDAAASDGVVEFESRVQMYWTRPSRER